MLSPFDALRERLLCAGIAPRHAHRYLSELQEHFTDLVAEESALAPTPTDAEARAMARLGTPEALARAMIERHQFRAWSARAPLAAYVLAPPAALGLCFAGAIVLIMAATTIHPPSTGGHPALPSWFAGLAEGLSWLTAFVAPVLLGWSLALMAIRQRARPLWPALGITVIAILGAAARLDVTLPNNAGRHGELSIDSVFLPPFSGVGVAALHAAASLAIICIPYLIADRLWRSRFGRSILSAYAS